MSDSSDTRADFKVITGCSDEDACRWLEVTAGDLEAAVALYMESQEGGGAASSSTTRSSPHRRGEGAEGEEEDGDGVRRPDSTKRQRLIDHPHPAPGLRMGGGAMRGASAAVNLNPFRDFGAETRGAFGQGGSPWDTPDAGIGALFAPPMKLLCKSSLADARAEAKRRKRFLLVNVQSDAVFASHLLNRDVFKDDVVEGMIADSFVFWQAQFTVPEARSFLDRYHHGVEALPLLSVLDPRTGREMWMWSHTGAVIDKSELAAKLMEICSSYSLDDDTALPPPPPRAIAAYDRSEDEQLALALSASVKEEEQRRKREVVTVDGSDEEEEEDEEEVDVVGTRRPAKKEEEEEVGKAATSTSTSASTAAAAVVVAPPAYLTAPLDEHEPTVGTPDTTRIQFRLPDGKRLQRIFPLAAPVASLYRFAHEYVAAADPQRRQQQGQQGQPAFDLTVFPAASLRGAMERGETLAGAKLANSAIAVMWTTPA